jgi:hypothetical protein
MTDDFKSPDTDTDKVKVSGPSKAPKKAPAKKRKPEAAPKPTGYVVAEGKALTTLSGRGVVGPGARVTAKDVGGEDRLKALAEAGYLKGA